MDRPLSSSMIEEAVPGMRTYKYGQLADFSELPRRPFTVLYETEPDYGHWVCIVDTPEGIEHFDPYGIIPDNELRWVKPGFRRATGQAQKHLIELLMGTGLPINYNPHKLQSKNSSTCGRWAILRACLNDLGNDDFVRAVRGVSKKMGIIPDSLAIEATADVPVWRA